SGGVIAAEVVEWFVGAGYAPPPATEMLEAFVNFINLAATCAPPRDKAWQRDPVLVEVHTALTVLRRALPGLVRQANAEEVNASSPGTHAGALRILACEQRASHLRALQIAVRAASTSFPPSLRPRKRIADWHATAEGAAVHIRIVLRQGGHGVAKFTS